MEQPVSGLCLTEPVVYSNCVHAGWLMHPASQASVMEKTWRQAEYAAGLGNYWEQIVCRHANPASNSNMKPETAQEHKVPQCCLQHIQISALFIRPAPYPHLCSERLQQASFHGLHLPCYNVCHILLQVMLCCGKLMYLRVHCKIVSTNACG